MRKQLLPSLKPRALPAGTINGETILNSKQFESQLHLAHSAYVAAAENYHLYVGLAEALPDGTGTKYYWFLNFYDVDAENEPHWTATASKQKMYEFALEKTRTLDPRFSEIVRLTGPENIKAPPIVFRDLPLDEIPAGRITLLGDAVSSPSIVFAWYCCYHLRLEYFQLFHALQ